MILFFLKTSAPGALALSLLSCGCSDIGTSQQPSNGQAVTSSSEEWITGDIPSVIPNNELVSVQEDARRGNNSAVDRLAEHYRTLGQTRDRVQWLVMAASRGDCSAMAHLREFWQTEGNPSLTAQWNNQLRINRCTWAKAYGPLSGNAAQENNMPLWTE
jgi:hypothetical protein